MSSNAITSYRRNQSKHWFRFFGTTPEPVSTGLTLYIEDKKIPLSQEAEREKDKWKSRENESKSRANISIDIRRNNSELSYLSMDDLANLVDKPSNLQRDTSLARDAVEYKPIRDALAHTALLSDLAKNRLNTVYENIKARVRSLLS